MMVQSQLWIIQNGCQVQIWIFFFYKKSFIKFVFCLSLKYPQAWLFMLRKVSIWYLLKKRGQWMFFFLLFNGHHYQFHYWSCDILGHVMWCKHMISVWILSVMVHVLGYIMAIFMNVLYFCIKKVCKLFCFICQIECLLLFLKFLLFLHFQYSFCHLFLANVYRLLWTFI